MRSLAQSVVWFGHAIRPMPSEVLVRADEVKRRLSDATVLAQSEMEKRRSPLV
jgi:hypothetical protein